MTILKHDKEKPSWITYNNSPFLSIFPLENLPETIIIAFGAAIVNK